LFFIDIQVNRQHTPGWRTVRMEAEIASDHARAERRRSAIRRRNANVFLSDGRVEVRYFEALCVNSNDATCTVRPGSIPIRQVSLQDVCLDTR
jgi:hypothetical protein